jgi:uncharacterized protein YndB with AHSA1/START domain
MATSVIDMQQTKSENLKLEIVRVIKASREQVFNAWTRPEMIRQWFRPMSFTMAEADVDARVGGEYRFAMTGAVEAEQNPVVAGRYTRVDPFDALAFTWTSCRNPDEQSLVTIELRDVEGGTEMKLTHEGFFTVESRDRHLVGWSSVVPKLAEFFEKD